MQQSDWRKGAVSNFKSFREFKKEIAIRRCFQIQQSENSWNHLREDRAEYKRQTQSKTVEEMNAKEGNKSSECISTKGEKKRN